VTFSALYDLKTRITTYDFFTWMLNVQSMGAREIVFKVDEGFNDRKWSEHESRQRFENYIRPGPDLAGLPSRIGTDGEDVGSHMLQELMQRPFKRMRTVFPPAGHRYTVTLRRCYHNKRKNSDQNLWRAFADRIGAHVIPDYDEKPIGLFERMSLYAGAEMNFGVPNGPMALCSMSPYPVTIFADPKVCAKGFASHGMAVGQQYPYALPGQRIVWERPTMAGLMREFRAMGFAA
jgi:hypothetical protein